MKYVVLSMMVLFLVSCQKEEFSLEQEQDNETNVVALTPNLQVMVQMVTKHDGSFDDIVDESSCFSIKFPYVCFFNGEPYGVQSVQDLAQFTVYDELIPEFPVTLVMSDHSEVVVNNMSEYDAMIQQCNSGVLDQELLKCMDLVYPFSVALYDPNTTDFETIFFNDDKSVFQAIENLSEGSLISMNYPMDIFHWGDGFVNVRDNDQLLEEITLAIGNCN